MIDRVRQDAQSLPEFGKSELVGKQCRLSLWWLAKSPLGPKRVSYVTVYWVDDLLSFVFCCSDHRKSEFNRRRCLEALGSEETINGTSIAQYAARKATGGHLREPSIRESFLDSLCNEMKKDPSVIDGPHRRTVMKGEDVQD